MLAVASSGYVPAGSGASPVVDFDMLSGPFTVAPFRVKRKTYFCTSPLSTSQPPLLPISWEPLTSIDGISVMRGSLADAVLADTSAIPAARTTRTRGRTCIVKGSFLAQWARLPSPEGRKALYKLQEVFRQKRRATEALVNLDPEEVRRRDAELGALALPACLNVDPGGAGSGGLEGEGRPPVRAAQALGARAGQDPRRDRLDQHAADAEAPVVAHAHANRHGLAALLGHDLVQHQPVRQADLVDRDRLAERRRPQLDHDRGDRGGRVRRAARVGRRLDHAQARADDGGRDLVGRADGVRDRHAALTRGVAALPVELLARRGGPAPLASRRAQRLVLHGHAPDGRDCGRLWERDRLRRNRNGQRGHAVLRDVVALDLARLRVVRAAVAQEDPFDEPDALPDVLGTQQVAEAGAARDVDAPARVDVAALPGVGERAVGAVQPVVQEPLARLATQRLPLLGRAVHRRIAPLGRKLRACRAGERECDDARERHDEDARWALEDVRHRKPHFVRSDL